MFARSLFGLALLLLCNPAPSRGQVSYVQGPAQYGQQAPQPSPYVQQQPTVSGQQPGGGSGGVLSLLSDLAPAARSISALMNSNSQQQPGLQQQQQPGGQQQSGLSSAMDAATLMGQLTEMIRSTQERQARAMESAQQAGQQIGLRSANAVQPAPSGIQAALSDLGNGLQRIALNNPNLLPDVKNLWQSVSSKLAPAPAGQSQFAQGVANQIAPQQPQPLPQPSF